MEDSIIVEELNFINNILSFIFIIALV